jgi:transposase-like protein
MPIPPEPYFRDEKKAFEYLEGVRWADGVVCPHCGAKGGRVYSLDGKSTRMGLKKCGECRKQFTVKIGTVFEHARMPLHKMLQAAYLLHSGERISIQQLHRLLGISYKSAWFLAQRMRKAIDSGELSFITREPRAAKSDAPFIGSGVGTGSGARNCSPSGVRQPVH